MKALASKVTNIKTIISDKVEDEDSTAVAPTGRQIAISRLTGRGGSLFRFNDPGTRGNNSTSLSKYNSSMGSFQKSTQNFIDSFLHSYLFLS